MHQIFKDALKGHIPDELLDQAPATDSMAENNTGTMAPKKIAAMVDNPSSFKKDSRMSMITFVCKKCGDRTASPPPTDHNNRPFCGLCYNLNCVVAVSDE